MRFLLLSLLLSMASISHAEQTKNFGDYVLHFNTFESTFLTPEIAQNYGFQRSKGRGLLNVAVTKKENGELPKPQAAIVTGKVVNLIGQIVQLNFVTIDEGDAIYYIAPFTKTNDEILKFTVSAQLNPNQAPMEVTFQRHVYVDK